LKPWDNTADAKWELDKAGQARRSLAKVRLKLVSPTVQSMDSSASELGVAVECLGKLEAGFRSGRRLTPQGRRLLELEMGKLRRELKEASVLLQGVGKFYEGWARLVATDLARRAAAGIEDAPEHYSMQGVAIPPAPLRSPKVVAIG
jgi:hypothetical protein